MKKINSSKTSSMPMLELIIVIGIFAICSIFLLQMFVSANIIEEKARDKSKGLLAAENVAESIKAGSDFQKTMQSLGFSDADDSYTKFYDENWTETKETDKYSITVFPTYSQTENGTLVQAELYVYRNQPYAQFGFSQVSEQREELCHLSVADYVPGDEE